MGKGHGGGEELCVSMEYEGHNDGLSLISYVSHSIFVDDSSFAPDFDFVLYQGGMVGVGREVMDEKLIGGISDYPYFPYVFFPFSIL